MSQETGEELNGRFTALQISNEEIKNAVLAVIPQLTMITTSGEERNQILAELRSIALLSNGHLEDIARYTQFIQNMGKDIAEIKRVWKK